MRSVTTNRQIMITILLTILTVIYWAPCAKASDYPEKPVSMIVGFPAGGPLDLAARLLAETSKAYFPKPIVVVNRPGGGSVISVAEVIQAAPDGYTLLLAIGSVLTLSPHVTSLPYKGPDDLQLVINTVIQPLTIAVGAQTPWKTMREMVDYAEANPGKIRIGLSGLKLPPHVALVHFMQVAKINMTIVPFQGAAPATTALLGGHVDGVLYAPINVMEHAKAGKVRILATFEPNRMSQFPDVPTLKELGYDVIRGSFHYIVGAPNGTPSKVTESLYKAFRQALDTQAFQKFVKDGGYVFHPVGASDLKKELVKEYTFYQEFTKTVKLD